MILQAGSIQGPWQPTPVLTQEGQASVSCTGAIRASESPSLPHRLCCKYVFFGETQAAVHIAQLRILPLPSRISERKLIPCVWDRFLLTHHNADALLRSGLSWLLFELTLTWEVLDQPQGSEGLGEPMHSDLAEAPALGPPTSWLHSGFNCPAPTSQPSALKHKHLLHIIPLLQNLQ